MNNQNAGPTYPQIIFDTTSLINGRGSNQFGKIPNVPKIYVIASAFDITGGNFILSDIEAPLEGTDGQQVILNLYADNNGLPGDTVLESWTCVNDLKSNPNSIHVKSVNNILLTSGMRYWVSAGMAGPNALGMWGFADGPNLTTAYKLNGGAFTIRQDPGIWLLRISGVPVKADENDMQTISKFFPFYAGLPLGIDWHLIPNPTGPSVVPMDGYLHYQVNNQTGYNQWLMLNIADSFVVRSGCRISYRVRANKIDCEEMKFTISPIDIPDAGLILRSAKKYGVPVPEYIRASDGVSLAKSAIRGDGKWHSIVMIIEPQQITLYEDGKLMFTHPVPAMAAIVMPRFDMQCLNKGDSLSFDLSNVTITDGILDPAPAIKHVFVLMLENHSFDHLLGLSNISGTDACTGQPTKINGVEVGSTYCNPYKSANSPDIKNYCVSTPAVDPMTTDPGHELMDTLEQLCGQDSEKQYNGKKPFPAKYPPISNSGFAANYAASVTEDTGHPASDAIGDVLKLCAPSQVPILVQLANEYAVCDSWFSSVPGPTWPNRMFATGGSAAGLDQSPGFGLKKDFFLSGFVYPKGSIFQQLEKYSKSWRLYNDYDNMFSNVRSTWAGSLAISWFIKGMSMFKRPYSLKSFAADLKSTYQEEFTFIEPNYGDAFSDTFKGGSSQHPMDGLEAGERLIAYVYNSIRQSPLWKSSLLIITYDEHGGFYDHVAPPPAPIPGDGIGQPDYNRFGFSFNQYGVRVPAVVVSPMVKKNVIDHSLYDHTSMLRTLEDIFYMQPLTARDLAAQSLLHLLDPQKIRPDEDCPLELTATPLSTRMVRTDPAIQAAADLEPLPESGNTIGFILIAAKMEIEMSGGTEAEKDAILANLASLKTKGDARKYVDSVMSAANARR